MKVLGWAIVLLPIPAAPDGNYNLPLGALGSGDWGKQIQNNQCYSRSCRSLPLGLDDAGSAEMGTTIWHSLDEFRGIKKQEKVCMTLMYKNT
jgi:hypothetical protein